MPAAKPRLMYANRCQGEFRDDSLEQLLPPEHPVRDLWQFVETLDLSAILTQMHWVPGNSGAPAIDPWILMATTDGVGSSRKLAELCDNRLVGG